MNHRTLRDLTLMSASMITIIGTTAIAASLPQMSDAFASTPNAEFLVRIALTLPALAAALSALWLGRSIDRWGRKPLFVTAMIVYGVAGSAGFFLTSLPAILVTRFILGVAVAAITACATALIADYTERDNLGRSMGRQSLFMALGNVVFVFLSGILAQQHWRWPFLLYTVAFLILPGVIWQIQEPRRVRTVGKILADAGETLPARRTALVCMIGFFNMVVYFMVPAYLPFFLRSFQLSSSVKVGTLLALVGVSWALASSQYPRLRRFLSFEGVVALAFATMGMAYLLLGMSVSYPQAIFALVLIGMGLGIIVPNLNAWLLSFIPAAHKGRALGTLIFCVFMGQFLSPVITQPLTSQLGLGLSYRLAGSALLLLALVATFVLIIAQRRRPGASLTLLAKTAKR